MFTLNLVPLKFSSLSGNNNFVVENLPFFQEATKFSLVDQIKLLL